VAEVAIRYVVFIFVIYVRSDTIKSPSIFHVVLVMVSNPLMFLELAFPNKVSNILSNLFNSSYIVYLGVFLYYLHRRLKNPKAELIFGVLKVLAFLALWTAFIMRQLHLVNQNKIEFVQYILMVVVCLPLLHHLWRLYFFRIKTILHRNVLFIALTIFYLLFLFLSGYIVNYGWKKISFFLIVQTYGIELCYLTSPVPLSNDLKTEPAEKAEQLTLPESDPPQEQMLPKEEEI
jgi:hypothetical protein